MEYEGDVVIIGDVDVKLRMFKNKVIALESEIKLLKSLNEELKKESTEANEKITYLKGRLAVEGKEKAASKRPPKKRFKTRKNFNQVAET
jgi:predicted HicB family RNase H-like nuclease